MGVLGPRLYRNNCSRVGDMSPISLDTASLNSIQHARRPNMTDPALTTVAAYVRMSTEHQQYSTTNQLDRISEFAKSRGMEVVRVFADEGKSGLQVRGRESLQRLIAVVQGGQPEFSAILVYDVS